MLAIYGMAGGLNQILHLLDRGKSKPPGAQLAQEALLMGARVGDMEMDRVLTKTCGATHVGVDHRLGRAEKNINDLWVTMRAEDEDIRKQLTKSFQDIERSLGRIEGQIRGLPHATGE